MFDNVDWNKIINSNLFNIKKRWEYLIVKAVVTKNSYMIKSYCENNNEFVDLDSIKGIDRKSIIDEFGKVTEKMSDDEHLFLTIKADYQGNVKVIYSDIKEGNKLPFDESQNYVALHENDKIM